MTAGSDRIRSHTLRNLSPTQARSLAREIGEHFVSNSTLEEADFDDLVAEVLEAEYDADEIETEQGDASFEAIKPQHTCGGGC